MKRFRCSNCRNELYFDNTQCVRCGATVGYLPATEQFLALSGVSPAQTATDAGQSYRLCSNARHGACNWLVPVSPVVTLCLSCRHTRTIPDLEIANHLAGWRAIELAKRQLFYSLLKWRLPLRTAAEASTGLAFDILADGKAPDGTPVRVMTGHDNGLITLNVAEADDAVREKVRTEMREPYRTLLGHFRHEIGHYYWDRLVRDGGKVALFREVFGDESADYGTALQHHYESGPPADWASRFITAYASMHPWEDFAETWAHYMHIVDGLETARAYHIEVSARPDEAKGADIEIPVDPYRASDMGALLRTWVPFTVALNSLNRSMGLRDFYPFVMSAAVVQKLTFIHDLVRQPRVDVQSAPSVPRDRTDAGRGFAKWVKRIRG